MTKVDTSFELSRALDERDLLNFSKLTSVYGILMAKMASSLDKIFIEYDASRLTPDEVQGVTERFGLPIKVPVP